MTFAEVRALFLSLLNRQDCTDEQADEFLALSVRRIQRDLRAPMMEKLYAIPVTLMEMASAMVPPDCLEVMEVLVDGTPLEKESFRGLRHRSPSAPAAYARFASTFFFAPPIPVGKTLEVLYYGEFEAISEEVPKNELTASAPDLMVYGALSVAGDHFEHDKRGEWEGRYVATLEGLREQARADEMGGGSLAVQPMYHDPGM